MILRILTVVKFRVFNTVSVMDYVVNALTIVLYNDGLVKTSL